MDGQAVQRVSEDAPNDLALFDVQGEDWETIHATIVQEYRKPYDLAHDPLVRFRLFKRGPDRWIIMKAVHHIVSDAISTFTFIEELLSVYEALRRNREPGLPPVEARYLDFLNQQNAFLAGPRPRPCSTTGARTCRPRSRCSTSRSTNRARRFRPTTGPPSSSSWTTR